MLYQYFEVFSQQRLATGEAQLHRAHGTCFAEYPQPGVGITFLLSATQINRV